MTINTTSKKIPAGGYNPMTGAINELNFPAAQRPGKAFETLRASFAVCVHTSRRTAPTDGPVTYWAERWGLVRHLPTLHDVALFLTQIGGRV